MKLQNKEADIIRVTGIFFLVVLDLVYICAIVAHYGKFLFRFVYLSSDGIETIKILWR